MLLDVCLLLDFLHSFFSTLQLPCFRELIEFLPRVDGATITANTDFALMPWLLGEGDEQVGLAFHAEICTTTCADFNFTLEAAASRRNLRDDEAVLVHVKSVHCGVCQSAQALAEEVRFALRGHT